MVKQYKIEVTYDNDSSEEYIIHSDETVEWIEQQKQKTVAAFITLFGSTNQIVNWFKQNGAKKVEITAEDE